MIVWKILYNSIILPLLWIAFQLLGLFNNKVRRGIEGRRNLFADLERDAHRLQGTSRIWFHSSSMGEFEQAKPIIAVLKKKYPYLDVIVTFFSPSGYEHSKSYKLATIVCYIPFDFAVDMKRFIGIIRPTAAVMVRYDVWPNAIWELEKAGIPIFIASATMKKDSLRKLPLLRGFHRRLYSGLSHILAVSEADVSSFADFGRLDCVVEAAGDTRFDQVMMRRDDALKRPGLPRAVIDGKRVLVIGQNWDADDDVVIPALLRLSESTKHLLVVIVPHEPTEENLADVERRLEGKLTCLRMSELAGYAGEQVILVDSVGGLVALYQHADVVYVGGGFRQGVHNVLEPAVFGLPVLYGPKHTNSQEAVALAAAGGGFVVRTSAEVYELLHQLFSDENKRLAAGSIARSFVVDHCGATERFLAYIEPLISPAKQYFGQV